MKKQVVIFVFTMLLTMVSAWFAQAQQAVDLGLSVKWASCNIGASKPEQYGDYYAWGEVITKSNYEWDTYRYCSLDNDKLTIKKYVTDSEYGLVDSKTVLDMSDDVANRKLGGKWRMPTIEEWNELLENCLWEWTTMNGKEGFKVTSYENGKSIFLPAAGRRRGTVLKDAGTIGYYWSASLAGNPSFAWYVKFYSGGVNRGDDYYRYRGLPVRPVTD